jgi:hypothetical protein
MVSGSISLPESSGLSSTLSVEAVWEFRKSSAAATGFGYNAASFIAEPF